MSAAAIMMVRDEADIVGYTIRHLLDQGINDVFVADNLSTDGTRAILDALAADTGRVHVATDSEVGYWQSRKMTHMARVAAAADYDWVLPVDADELWLAPDGLTLAELLASHRPNVQIVQATLLDHLPTGEDDPDEPNPFRRIGWRLQTPGGLPKVCARAADDLIIHAGNHGASYENEEYTLAVGGLTVRHYTWRTEAQYVRKIRNGLEAYALTDLPADTGAHWRMFTGADDAAIAKHFNRWFYAKKPRGRDDLIYDPAPL